VSHCTSSLFIHSTYHRYCTYFYYTSAHGSGTVMTAVCWSWLPCHPPRTDNSLRQPQLPHCQTLNLERSSLEHS